MRVDLYGLVHKGQRYRLFTFARELSRGDLTDPATCAHVANEVRELAGMLRDHAENERRYIHPLFVAAGYGTDALDHEHAALEGTLAEWETIVERGMWDDLYRVTMQLIGNYLLHIAEEEAAQASSLWPRYSDAELGAVFTRFKAERDPTAARADLALMLPAMNPAEFARLLGGLRSAPESLRREISKLADRPFEEEAVARAERTENLPAHHQLSHH